jgi:probable F420-dependent oxidoreductase
MGLVEVARLGPTGVFLGPLARGDAHGERDVARRLEDAGYGALWYGESPGSRETLAHAALLLQWTERLVVATGIAVIYARDPLAALAGGATLTEAYPDRFVLGLGVSHADPVARRGASYGPPLTAMREYLDGMDAGAQLLLASLEPAPRVLAALGPRMLALAAERSWGAHPYFVPVEHTRRAREILGPERLLAPEQGFVLETDPVRARERAREHMRFYLSAPNYRNSLLRLGYSEAELDAVADRVVDDLVAWGEPAQVAERVAEHRRAGADHVIVQALGADPVAELLALAPVLGL